MNINNRRGLLAAGLAAIAAPVLAAPQKSGKRLFTPPSMIYPITINRFQRDTDFVIPKGGTVTFMPWERQSIQQTSDVVLQADGMILVQTQGLYRIVQGLDWKAQEQTDTDTRLYGIRRKIAGDTTAPNLQDQRLASFDHPGSDSPVVSRFSMKWTPGTVQPGQPAYIDVTMPMKGNDIVLGDYAQASLSSTTENMIGLTASLLVDVRAKVIAKNVVRVILVNQTGAAMNFSEGTLNVMAISATQFRGESEDAWNVLDTPLTELFPGDRIYTIVKNQTIKNDYVQPSENSTFLQIEKFG